MVMNSELQEEAPKRVQMIPYQHKGTCMLSIRGACLWLALALPRLERRYAPRAAVAAAAVAVCSLLAACRHCAPRLKQ